MSDGEGSRGPMTVSTDGFILALPWPKASVECWPGAQVPGGHGAVDGGGGSHVAWGRQQIYMGHGEGGGRYAVACRFEIGEL